MINIENINIDNGTENVVINNDTYKCWKLEYIKPYVVKFLKEKFPDSLVIFEINRIDIVVLDNKNDHILPVEIQKTVINKDRYTFMHSEFEEDIRKQIEDNVENYGECWFFFDSEYLRYLQSGNVYRNISINMNWLVKYMKDSKVRVFVTRYDGITKELLTKDFDFLKVISQTCPIGQDSDERILNRNKLRIFMNILMGHKFNQEEIDKIYKNAKLNRNNVKSRGTTKFLLKEDDKRSKLYGYILVSISRLEMINEILDMNYGERHGKQYASYLGIFDIDGRGNIRFTDRFDVCKYFPGYLRNKDIWDNLKGHNINSRQFESIASKKIDMNKGVDYFWYKE